MKAVFFSIFFVFTAVLFSGYAFASDCVTYVGDCSYYECRSYEMACADTDYLMRFGSHYCQAFDREIDKFTPQGRDVLAAIKSCLQVQLEDQQGLTCSNALDFAYQQHERCYLEAGFCNLSFSDKWLILWTVMPELKSAGFRNVVARVSAGCR